MKISYLLAVAAAPFMFSTAFAAPTDVAPKKDHGLYVRADLGQTVSPDAEVSGFSVPLDDDLTYSGAIGGHLGIFRVEAEARKVTTSVAGLLNANATIFSVNGYLDFNQEGRLQPFLGGGVGLAKAEVNAFGSTLQGDGIAYNAAAGVGYKASDSVTLEAGYHYVSAPDLDFGSGFNVDFSTQAFTVGARLAL